MRSAVIIGYIQLTNLHRLLSCDVQAFDATVHLLHPNVIQQDLNDARRWALLSGPGFYSFPHVDGSGLASYLAMTCGVKYWAVLWPKEPITGDTAAIYREKTEAAFRIYAQIARYSNNYTQAPIVLPDMTTVHVFKLAPGMLL